MGPAPRFPAFLVLGVILAAVTPAAALLVHPGVAAAQVVINEILPNPTGNDVGTERIEIYNAGSTPVDMTGWAIDDAATINDASVRCRIPEDFDIAACPGGVIIGPHEFRVLKGQSTAAFLNNSGGDVVYLVSNRTVPAIAVSTVTYPDAVAWVDSVWAAVPNGTTNFAWHGQTLCASNGGPTGDVIPPATVTNLAAEFGATPGEILLTWTAPGDDGTDGTASEYEIRVSHDPITPANFAAAADLEHWINEPIPAPAATPETLYVFGLDPDSTYYFALRTRDEVPNTGDVSNSAGHQPRPGTRLDSDLGFTPYFGNLHSHTSYSDGVQTPPDAYNFARNLAPTPLDFLEVSDHNHLTAGMSYPNYALGRSQAAAANDDGNFVAIYGQEWGLASHGHVIVVNSPVLFGWDAGNYDVFVAEGDYAGLYTAALANPPADSPVILELCHPAAGDFNSLAVTPDALAAVHLMALVNGPAFSTNTTETDIGNTGFDVIFKDALRKGFRVSPTADQDNHNATWGASSESRTAVLATAKTKSAILAALAARRCYATQDHNVRVEFSADGHAMGEAFSAARGIRIAVQVTDPDLGESVNTIELYRGITGVSSATRVAFNSGSSSLQWREVDRFDSGTEVHYYVRILMADLNSIWTGPVYVTYDASIPVAVGEVGPASDLSLAASPNPAPGALTARFVLPRSEAHVSLAVYDPQGRRVRTLVHRSLEAGAHQVHWDGRGEDGRSAGSGIFFLRLETSGGSIAHKILLLQ